MKNLIRPVNLRDLGGYLGVDDKRVKNFSLLRSGEVTNISSTEEIMLLEDYKLKTIVDFRSELEITNAPDSEIENTKYFHIDIMKSNSDKTTSLKNFSANMDEESINSYMVNSYRDFIVDGGAVEGYREFFDLLLKQEEGSLLFHCFAGKDRTGFGAALILTVLGVSKDDIYRDYLMTNAMRADENVRILGEMKAHGIPEDKLGVVEIALNVRREYLDMAYDTAVEAYGSLENYIRDAIKLDVEEQKAMVEKYLE